MRPKGTIYKLGKSENHGEAILHLSKLLKNLFYFLRGAGLGLIFLAFYMFFSSFGPVFWNEVDYQYKVTAERPKYDYSKIAKESETLLSVQREAKSYKVGSQFSVVIPKIDATANIIPNVDASNREEYANALMQGVAHAKGTNFPGENGRIFLFSHSTDSPFNFYKYNAIFYLLGHLEKDDSIIVFFADKKYKYKVSELKVISPSETEWIMPKLGEEELVLMTCDPPGTSWRRLLVFAKPEPESVALESNF